jgi:hypothetical protein
MLKLSAAACNMPTSNYHTPDLTFSNGQSNTTSCAGGNSLSFVPPLPRPLQPRRSPRQPSNQLVHDVDIVESPVYVDAREMHDGRAAAVEGLWESFMTAPIRELLASASPRTKDVDDYMLRRLGPTRYFFDIYLAHGKRSIEVAEGDKLTCYSCTCGCVHPQGAKQWPIPHKQKQQAIYDHIFRKKHVVNCRVSGTETPEGLEHYMDCLLSLNPRAGRWTTDGNRETRSKNDSRKKGSRGKNAQQNHVQRTPHL